MTTAQYIEIGKWVVACFTLGFTGLQGYRWYINNKRSDAVLASQERLEMARMRIASDKALAELRGDMKTIEKLVFELRVSNLDTKEEVDEKLGKIQDILHSKIEEVMRHIEELNDDINEILDTEN